MAKKEPVYKYAVFNQAMLEGNAYTSLKDAEEDVKYLLEDDYEETVIIYEIKPYSKFHSITQVVERKL